jgi:hypothetical protein
LLVSISIFLFYWFSLYCSILIDSSNIDSFVWLQIHIHFVMIVIVISGVFKGFQFARKRGISKIKVQVDSRVVVQTLNNSDLVSVSGWRFIQKIRQLLALDWNIIVCHSYRGKRTLVRILFLTWDVWFGTSYVWSMSCFFEYFVAQEYFCLISFFRPRPLLYPKKNIAYNKFANYFDFFFVKWFIDYNFTL